MFSKSDSVSLPTGEAETTLDAIAAAFADAFPLERAGLTLTGQDKVGQWGLQPKLRVSSRAGSPPALDVLVTSEVPQNTIVIAIALAVLAAPLFLLLGFLAWQEFDQAANRLVQKVRNGVQPTP